MKGTYLGEFEELVLLVIAKLDQGAYGVAIRDEIEEQSKRTISIGAVHASTNRLEDKGYLSSFFGEASNQRGGKRKKYYLLTNYGVNALKTSMELRSRIWNEIPQSVLATN